MNRFFIILISIFLLALNAEAKENPVEIGSVQWGRNLDKAFKKSAKTGRPVLVLFQEVPGCSGCQDFGKTVLTYPLLVEAIEEEFLPVLVYNNWGGEDRKLLDRFNEPAWNYQVIRFFNAQGHDIIPRKDRIWDIGGVASRMIKALETANRPVPKYLETVAMENNKQNHAVVAFAMYCFWSGEVALGKIEGVIETEAGWIEGREVTRVVYDNKKITLQTLVKKAQEADSARKVYLPGNEASLLKALPTGWLDGRYRKARASDQKKQLEKWKAMQSLPGLTRMQKTKINAYAPSSRSKALEWLSPRQRNALGKAK